MNEKEKAKEIEELAGLWFSPKQIALICGVDLTSFLQQIETEAGPFYLAFERGRLKEEAAVRKSILQMAKQGSSPAQKQMMDIINENRETPISNNTSPTPQQKTGRFDLGVDI